MAGLLDWRDAMEGEEVANSGGVRFNKRTGRNYLPRYSTQYNGQDGQSQEVTGYMSWEPHANRSNEGAYVNHDLGGNVTGQGNFQPRQKTARDALIATAALMAAGFGGAALMGGGAGGGVAGAGAGLAELGGSGAFLGEGLHGAGVWTAAGGLEGAGAAGAGGLFNAAADSQLANVGIDAAGGNALSGYSGASGVTASPINGGSSIWESLSKYGTDVLSDPKRLIPLLTSLAGGAAGAKGSGGGGGLLDPRMEEAIYGTLLPGAQELYRKQSAPGYLRGYEDMRTVGQGLLNTPVRGNGFSLFSGRK